MFNKSIQCIIVMLIGGQITSCLNNTFSGVGKANGPAVATPDTQTPGITNNSNVVTNQPNSTSGQPTIPTNMQLCSQDYYVPATANPYFAGVPSGTAITYALNAGDPPTPTDSAPQENPVLITPTDPSCLSPGKTIYFSVHGSVSHSAFSASSDANGNQGSITGHQKNGLFGKSNITAPINSLIGVFLGAGDPSTASIPSALDFSTLVKRDYQLLQPQLGQIFFIGTGMTSGGTTYHQIVVPQGAVSFYMAIMDSYQWNNNLGGLYGAIMVAK